MSMGTQLDRVAEKLSISVTDKLRQRVREEIEKKLDQPVYWFGDAVSNLREYVRIAVPDVLDSVFNSGSVSGAFFGWLEKELPGWQKEIESK